MDSDFISARDVYSSLGYVDWRNFRGVVERAANLIRNGERRGSIIESTKAVAIGFGAKRTVPDYLMSKDAFELVVELASSYKLNHYFGIRNETVILSLLRKYCTLKGMTFHFQNHLDYHVFDALVGANVLVEFDEPHHKTNIRNMSTDSLKATAARANGYTLLRFDLNHDIVDVILAVEEATRE